VTKATKRTTNFNLGSAKPIGFALLFLAIACQDSRGEIEKHAIVDCKGICFYWWPKLAPIPGWHSDQAVNYSTGENGANVLIPDGSSFADADTIMYASATFKPRYEKDNPKSKSLAAFIADDEAHFREEGRNIAQAAPLTTKNGQTLRSLTFILPKGAQWERVSYGEEGEYYLLFVISSRTESGFRKNQDAYEHLVEQYRR
jgi:hypothetical protein